ncbi:MAG: cation:proton antiporter [Flavobacteriales bacterium]
MQNNLDIFVSVLISIIIILISTQLVGKLFLLMKQPKVVGEMLAGVLLGPTCFGYFYPELSAEIFRKDLMPYIFVLSNIGLSIYMFLVAMEMDFNLFTKKIFKQSFSLSAAIIIVPFILGAVGAVQYFDFLKGENADLISFIIFLGAALAITAFPMLARILQENNLIQTKLGTISLLSASFQDVISWIFLAFVTASAKNDGSSGMNTLIGGIIFILGMRFLVKPLLKWLFQKANDGKISKQNLFSVVILALLFCALITDYIGLYSVFGGFILGITIPRDAPLMNDIGIKLKDVTITLLIPLFFTFSGLNANMLVLGEIDFLIPTLVILFYSFASKYLIATSVMKLNGFSWKESSAIGGLMNARGLMELIIANIGLMYGVINPTLYSILILVAVLSTLLAMPIYNLSMKE